MAQCECYKGKAEGGRRLDQRREGSRAPSPGSGLRLRSEGWEGEKRISQAEGEVRAPLGRRDSKVRSWEVPDKLEGLCLQGESEGERA